MTKSWELPNTKLELTKSNAIGISVEIWEWLAKTGGEMKYEWKGWEKYGRMIFDCPLCEYAKQQSIGSRSCSYCPYFERYGYCDSLKALYHLWAAAESDEDRMVLASRFLKQLKTLKKEVSSNG